MTLEDRIYDRQYTKIKARFGKKIADNANYGWAVDGDGPTVIVSTKVYHPDGAKVLTTYGARQGRFTHQWSSYR